MSFPWLHGALLYGHTEIYLYNLELTDIGIFSQFGFFVYFANANSVATDILVHISHCTCARVLQGRQPGEKLLGTGVHIFNHEIMPNCFAKQLYPFTLLFAGFWLLHSLADIFCQTLIFANLIDTKQHITVVAAVPLNLVPEQSWLFSNCITVASAISCVVQILSLQ